MRKNKILSMVFVVVMLVMVLIPTTLAAAPATTTITPSNSNLTIKTQGGNAVLVDGRKTHILTENTIIKLTRHTEFTLSNTAPAYIHSIDASNLNSRGVASPRCVEFEAGKGTLYINNTTGNYGIYAEDVRVDAPVTIHATGQKMGIYADGKFKIENAGVVYATGGAYGLYGKGCQIEVRHAGSRLEALATNEDGIGVVGMYCGISIKADRGGVIIGEGGVCGVKGREKVYAADGGTVHGISRNINSGLSAVWAGSYIKAYHENHTTGEGRGTIIDEYLNTGIEINDVPLVINKVYPAVGRNMVNLANYDWRIDENTECIGIQDGGLIATEHYGRGTIIGSRDYNKRLLCTEAVVLKKMPSQHLVIFRDAAVTLEVPIVVEHYMGAEGQDYSDYQLMESTVYEAVPGTILDESVYASLAAGVEHERMRYLPNSTASYEVLPIKEGNVIKLYYRQYAMVTFQDMIDLDQVGIHVPGGHEYQALYPVGSTVSNYDEAIAAQMDVLVNEYEVVEVERIPKPSIVVDPEDKNNLVEIFYFTI